jgi:hypothetical protein
MVLLPCSSCCCKPCEYSPHDCIELTLAGFSGNPGTFGCQECDHLDGTYILRRGLQAAQITASISATGGSGAEVAATLSQDEETEKYTISSVTLVGGGSNYTPDAHFDYTASHAAVPPCGGEPVVNVILDRLQPTLSMSTAGGGSGATFTATLSPVATASGSETWGISSVAVGGGGGAGYADGSKLSVVVSGRVVEESAADMFLNVIDGAVESVAVNNSGEYYMTGGVESLNLVYGGDFYPTPACDYTWQGCAACCENNKLKIAFSAGGEEHTLKATTVNEYGNTTATIFEAVAQADGGDWTDLTFASDSFYPGVASIAVTAGGSGYASPPTVTITGDGSGAEAVATVMGYVDSVTLTNAGDDFYETAPTVTISGGGGSGATATAAAGFGGLKITLGSGGSGYTSVPTVTISGGGGSGATAVATIRQAVEAITVTKAGSGYTAPPTVTLSGGGGVGASAVATLDREPIGCYASGTATLSEAVCTKTSDRDLPDQITMTLSGIAPIFWWASQNGGSPPGVCVEDGGPSGWGNVFCGRCDGAPEDGIRYRVVGNAFGPAGYTLAQAIDNFAAVLDRGETQSCSPVVYSGMVESLPSAGYLSGEDTTVLCGGDLSVQVSLALECIQITTTVSLSPPTKGDSLETATAEITGISGGVISGLTITNPGSGYAVEIIERVAPEIAVGVTTAFGTDGDLSATLTKTGEGDEAFWSVESVEVSDGGTNYAPGEEVSFSTSDESYDPAVAYITVATTAPTLSVEAPGGSGAEMSVTLAETTDYYGNALWVVDSITVSDGGDGYEDGSAVTFTVDDGSMKSQAFATISTTREEPAVTATVESASGSGAVLAVSLTQSGSSWYVSEVSVTDGGSGYDAYYSDYLTFATDDTESSPAYAAIETDGNGSITSVSISDGGSYYRSTGVIDSVSISDGGQYYKSDGAIESVVVLNGGMYWRLQGTGQADADEPTVTVSGSYGIGEGATATATVDTAVGSPTFGQISSVSLTSGGTGYKSQASGWRATVSVGGLIHRTECLVLNDAAGCAANDECPGFSSSYQEPESSRVTDEVHPGALISRSYKMAYRSQTFGNGYIDNAGAASYCFSGAYGATLTIADMGAGDIVVALAPA